MQLLSSLAVAAALAPFAAAQQDAKASKQPAKLSPLIAHRQLGFDSIDPALCKKWLTYL